MSRNSLKLFFSFLLVGSLSAIIAVALFSQINKSASGDKSAFQQAPLRSVSYGDSTGGIPDFTVAAEKSVHAVVHIKSTVKRDNRENRGPQYFNPYDFFRDLPNTQRQPRIGFGSGVIISTDGYIITNNHVVDGADELEVKTNDNKTYKAKLIGKDEVSDLALIKIEATNLSVIPFGNSDQLRVGEWVLAIGNPFNLTSTVTAGIVSAKGRGGLPVPMDASGKDQMRVESYIQTDAAVNPGNSGGALVNTRGELVGINTAIYSETGSYAGYSFAIPASIAYKVANDLKAFGTVQRAVLGVYMQSISALDPDVSSKLKVTEGAYISEFASSSSAKSAGMEVGDVITKINNAPIKTPSDLQEQISLYKPGEKVTVVVQRGSVEKKYTVELKNKQGNTEIVKNEAPSDILGATFKELSAEQKKLYKVDFGIEISDIKNGKIRNAGIGKGFIILVANDRRIEQVDNLNEIVEELLQQGADDRGLFLKGFYPKGKIMFYAINLGE